MTYKELLEYCGGTQTKMAAFLGCSQGAISRWGKDRTFPRVPVKWQLIAEKMSAGKLRTDQYLLPAALRSDDTPPTPPTDGACA